MNRLQFVFWLQIFVATTLHFAPSAESHNIYHFGRSKGNDPGRNYSRIHTGSIRDRFFLDASWEKQDQQTSNQFIDFLLSSLGSMVVVEQIQPLPIPNTHLGFRKKKMGIRFTGEVEMFNGTISDGLETVHRVGDATLAKRKNGTHGSFMFSFGLEINNLHFNTKFHLKFMHHGPEGDVKAIFPGLQIEAALKATFPNPPSTPAAMAAMQEAMAKGGAGLMMDLGMDAELVKTQVTELDPFDVKVHAAHVGPFLGFVSKIVARAFKTTLKHKIEDAIDDHLADIIDRGFKSPILQPVIQLAMKIMV